MTSRYEAMKDGGPTGVGSAASFATANGGFVTQVNSSAAKTCLENRSDPPDALGEDAGLNGQPPLDGAS